LIAGAGFEPATFGL